MQTCAAGSAVIAWDEQLAVVASRLPGLILHDLSHLSNGPAPKK